MKVIIHAEPDEIERVAKLILDKREMFACHPERIGWGWVFGLRDGRSFFLRQIKGGISARPVKERDGNGG